MNAALQNANGPAATAIAPDRGSIHPSKDQEMNDDTNNTISSTAPEKKRPVGLKLLDLHDFAISTGFLIDAMDMAIADIDDRRHRDAMRTFSDVIIGRMDDLKGQIEAIREELV